MDVSIIILNYKTKGLAKQCLRGIFDSHPNISFEVIVVDNASHDGISDMLEQQFPQVRFIGLPVNGGFAVGNNAGLKQASGDFLLILNPDVAVFPGGIDSLVDYLRQHERVGLVVPKLINPDGSTQASTMRFPTFLTPLWRRTPLGRFPVPAASMRRYVMEDWDHRDSRAIGWALGACFLIRRQAMAEVGIFDERFFLYVEDTDYCRRMWQSNWAVHYDAAVEFVHYHERLSAKRPFWAGFFSYPARIHMQSWIKYFAKYLGAPPAPPEHCI